MYESSLNRDLLKTEMDYRVGRIRRRVAGRRAPPDPASPTGTPGDVGWTTAALTTDAPEWSAAPRQQNTGSWPAWHHTSRTLVGRDAELAEIASLLGVRPCARPDVTPAGRRPALGRRRRRQDPPADRAARPRRRRGLAGRSPVTASTSATARCPTSRSRRCSAGWPPTCPTIVDAGRRAAPRAGPAPARAPGDGPTRTRDDEPRARPRPTCSRPCTRCSRRSPRRRRCCSSSRTPTGPTSRPATCSASSSPGRSPARSAIVASYRSDDLHRRHPLRRQVAEWSRHPRRRTGSRSPRCPTTPCAR